MATGAQAQNSRVAPTSLSGLARERIEVAFICEATAAKVIRLRRGT